jgi:N-acetylneuraminic acid mutarotase
MMKIHHTLSGLLVAVLMTWLANRADAHFLWLVMSPRERPAEVKLYFGETAMPDDPELLDKVGGAKGYALGGRRSEPQPLEWTKVDDALVAKLPQDATSSAVVNLTYGVVTRGEKPFLLKYYAKAYPSSLPGTWQAVADNERLPLEIVPQFDGASIAIEVRWQGEPAIETTVTVDGPGLSKSVEGTTDAKGIFRTTLPEAGLYSIRARRIEAAGGQYDGKAYNEVRHYTTLAMPYTPAKLAPIAHRWPALPRATTSFGGAVAGDWLYVYGGHYGQAHHYSREGQSGDFRRLNLKQPSSWEDLPGGPKLTGLAMVAHGGKLYRIGGFTAKNGEGEDESLWSQADFSSFDPQTSTWTDLPSLPEGRSSHDAAVVGNTLYVVGGWNMQAGKDTVWHDTAWSVDLSGAIYQWKPIAKPPFLRRAVALAAWQGKLHVLGGMQQEGGPTTRVDVYDPATDKWSAAPAMLGNAMDGFGCSAFACDGGLYVTTMSGSVQRLSSDGSEWELVGNLEHPRFFHRLLRWQPQELVIVGGAHMAVGKIDSLERLPVTRTK